MSKHSQEQLMQSKNALPRFFNESQCTAEDWPGLTRMVMICVWSAGQVRWCSALTRRWSACADLVSRTASAFCIGSCPADTRQLSGSAETARRGAETSSTDLLPSTKRWATSHDRLPEAMDVSEKTRAKLSEWSQRFRRNWRSNSN